MTTIVDLERIPLVPERVLEEMRVEGEHFRVSGDAAGLWKYVSSDVSAWFAGHIESMDHVTAQFIASRGG